MNRSELVALYRNTADPQRRAMMICRVCPTGYPVLIGVLLFHSSAELAAVAIAILKRRYAYRPHNVAVTVCDGGVYLEQPAQADAECIAMVVNRRSSVIALSEALEETRRELAHA